MTPGETKREVCDAIIEQERKKGNPVPMYLIRPLLGWVPQYFEKDGSGQSDCPGKEETSRVG